MRKYGEELELINYFRDETPVDVDLLVRSLGIDLDYLSLPPDVSGHIAFDERAGRYSIAVNRDHPRTRQRFTIAHELGHYMRHRAILSGGTNDNRAYRTDDTQRYYNPSIKPHHETEANRFAANVLMPVETVRRLKAGGASAADMAQALQVSPMSMKIRLDGLERFAKIEAQMMSTDPA